MADSKETPVADADPPVLTGRPDIVVAFIAPTGCDRDSALKIVRDTLEKRHGYEVVDVRISDLIQRLHGKAPDDATQRIQFLQDKGNATRDDFGNASALALGAVYDIYDQRGGDGSERAYLVWSLKHKDEIGLLRDVFGDHCVVISLYQPKGQRQDQLERSGVSQGEAHSIIKRDESDPDGTKFGQAVGDAYPLADVFVSMNAIEACHTGKCRQWDLRAQVERFFNMYFGDPFASPTRDEYAMAIADAAARRSADHGRQVGACIADPSGDILATGTNEVPSPLSGQYWEGDDWDKRDWFFKDRITAEYLAAEEAKRAFQHYVDSELKRQHENHAGEPDTCKKCTKVADSIESQKTSFLRSIESTRFGGLVEFMRAVHAEMGAITEAARRGLAVGDKFLFTTAFPCHECTRHIIASGIKRTVFLFPYPKSLATELHGDAVDLLHEPGSPDGPAVTFEPFVGVAPTAYHRYFRPPVAGRRMNKDGKRLPLSREPERGSQPRLVADALPVLRQLEYAGTREALRVRMSFCVGQWDKIVQKYSANAQSTTKEET